MSRITKFLSDRFPQNDSYAHHLGELLSAYKDSGLASPHLVKEVVSGADGKLWARVWEAMLYRHLLNLGFKPHSAGIKKSGERGPDFGIVHQGQTIWIEAVTPAPERIPSGHLEPPPIWNGGAVEFKSIPYEQKLLRWTSVLQSKRKKLESDRKKHIIDAADCTVIAVNSGRLQDYAPNDLGISGLPFAVEAVFPIGPIAYPITSGGEPDGEPINVPRYTIQNHNNSAVSTDIFHNPHYANISCRRPIKMSPLCQIEMTLPGDFPEGVWGDGTADERWRAWAA
jgi:type I restriction enzyme S subunit